jgi:hypothetical protein
MAEPNNSNVTLLLPYGDTFHCDSWFGRLGIHDHSKPQLFAVCWMPESLLPCGILLLGVILMYENFRQLVSKRGCRRKGFFPVMVWATSIYTIYYNHKVMFLYLNDHWWQLFKVQLFFQVTDDISLVLRFLDWLPEIRAAIHGYHLIFWLLFEQRKLKYCLFFLDDLSNLLYAIFCRPPEKELAYDSVPKDDPGFPGAAENGLATVVGQPNGAHPVSIQKKPEEKAQHRLSVAQMRLWLLVPSVVVFGGVAAFTVFGSERIT